MVCWFSPEYGVTAAGFLQFDAKDFDDIALSPFGKKLISKISNELKGIADESQINSIESH